MAGGAVVHYMISMCKTEVWDIAAFESSSIEAMGWFELSRDAGPKFRLWTALRKVGYYYTVANVTPAPGCVAS